ncbi:hypothetical protein GQ53DRAFT_816940 [Thozetella sp. PMI_491]|nr:hypothetical protein GQ53DRAFT_816940 [Thozetella sp. PMI_491]
MRSYFLVVASSACLLVSFTLSAVSRWVYTSDSQCVRHLFPYSPALDAVRYSSINYGDWWYPHSPYRGFTPAVEEKWAEYVEDGVISVPLHELPGLNVPPNFKPWPVTPAEGGGVAAVPSIFYHTNCLNLIRKWVFRDVHDYTSDDIIFDTSETPRAALRAQIHQCFETLRQELVCQADVSLHLFWPDPMQITSYNPDNAVQHRCRNYHGLKDWVDKHQIEPLHNATGRYSDLYFPKLPKWRL